MEDNRSYLPAEWNSEERIRALFGPMPQPHDTVACNARNVFWTGAIHQWCRQTNILTFTVGDALTAFRRGTQQPVCIPDVLLNMQRAGYIMPLTELPVGEQQQESWLKWGQRVLLSEPTRFAWNKLKTTIGGKHIEGKIYVNTVVLQEKCEDILRRIWESSTENYVNNLPVALPKLYLRISDCIRSADDLHLIVGSLAHQGRATTSVHNEISYVKFSLPGDTQAPAITQMDLAENDLQCAQIQIEDSMTSINTEIAQLQAKAKSAIQAGSKVQALSCLRQKKRLEKALEKQMGAMENVVACLHQLQDARINKQVLMAFKTGVEAIRSSISGNTSADSVATTMDDLQEVLEECQDIGSLIAGGIKPSDEVDDDSLKEELEELLSVKAESPSSDNLINRMAGLTLPDVPESNPLASENEMFKFSPPESSS